MFWFLKSNGVAQIPSAKTLRNQNAALHSMCGIRTLEYDGAFGHKFFINSLADIICQVRSPLLFSMIVRSFLCIGNGQSTRLTLPPLLP